MKRTELKGGAPAPLITVGSRDALSPFRQSDWGGLLDATGLEVSGWRVLSPQRYVLLSLVLLGLGGLYHQPWLIFGGGVLIAWITRRAHLLVSAERGCVLSLSMCGLTYQRLRLPLWTPAHIERHGALSTVWLGSLKSSFHIYELSICHRERAEEYLALYREGARRAQASRLVHPVSPPLSMNGEWQVSLIELFPLISGPRSSSTMGELRLSWWAPRIGDLITGASLLTLSPFSLVLSPSGGLWPLMLSLLSCVCVFFGCREELMLTSTEYQWTRRWLRFPIARQRWSSEVSVSLVSDPSAPHGRHVLLYEPGAPESAKALGATWDSDWIWSQLASVRGGSSS